MSLRSPKSTPKSDQRRFSREGFVPLSKSKTTTMPGDVTVDIPLAPVQQSHTNKNMESSTFGQYTQPEKQTEKNGLFNRGAGKRHKVAQSQGHERPHHHEDEEIMTQMGRIYSKILNFSVVTRWFVYVLPVALIIAIPIIIGATAAKKAKIDTVRIVWFFTWIEIMWLGLWVSKVFARFLPSIFQFLCGIVSSGTRKYAMVLRSLETPITLVGWSVVNLATFRPLMTQNPDARKAGPGGTATRHWEDVLSKILAALLVASLVYLVEKSLVQMISIGYHRRQFNAKIRSSKHNIYLLSLLYDASRTLFPAYCAEFAEEDYVINDSISVQTTKVASHNRSGSATPLRVLRDIGRVGDKITSAFGNVAQEITGKQVFNPTSAHSVVVEALEKTRSSEALAKRLWMSFVVEGKDALFREDIVEVLGSQRHDEAEECFAALDRDGNGDVSLDEMIMTVVEYGHERHSLASSMHDVDQAIHVLDQLLSAVVAIIVVLVFVGFLNTSFTTTLATAGTALLSLSFVFAATTQEVLGSCVFLFVKHPYDVGDRVDIDTKMLTVEHISLLFTVFKRVDNHKTVQIPNIVLNQTWIENITRSKAMRERVLMYINFDTKLEDIHALKNEMQSFVLDKENSRDFQPEIDVEVTGIAEMNKLELQVEIRHKSNWSNETLRAARRSKFMCALVLALRKVPIYAPGGGDAALGDLGKPSYSVAISEATAAAARKKYLDEKEAKRLYPSALQPLDLKDIDEEEHNDSFNPAKSTATEFFTTSKSSTRQRPSAAAAATDADMTRPSTAAASEQTAVEALTTRNPALDHSRPDGWEAYHEDMTSLRRTSSDTRRSNEIEEVRGLLHRQNTHGKRKATAAAATTALATGAGAGAGAQTIPIINEPRAPTSTESDMPGAERQQYPPPPAGWQYAQKPLPPTQPRQNQPQQQSPPPLLQQQQQQQQQTVHPETYMSYDPHSRTPQYQAAAAAAQARQGAAPPPPRGP